MATHSILCIYSQMEVSEAEQDEETKSKIPRFLALTVWASGTWEVSHPKC